jgi:hypothetical protein
LSLPASGRAEAEKEDSLAREDADTVIAAVLADEDPAIQGESHIVRIDKAAILLAISPEFSHRPAVA